MWILWQSTRSALSLCPHWWCLRRKGRGRLQPGDQWEKDLVWSVSVLQQTRWTVAPEVSLTWLAPLISCSLHPSLKVFTGKFLSTFLVKGEHSIYSSVSMLMFLCPYLNSRKRAAYKHLETKTQISEGSGESQPELRSKRNPKSTTEKGIKRGFSLKNMLSV